MAWLDVALILATNVLLLPFLVFWGECWLALFARKQTSLTPPQEAGEVWVVIPAHNESAGIVSTIKSLTASLKPNQHVLVIADHCDDNTEELARAQGVEVIARSGSANRGKGFALNYGFHYLAEHKTPDVILVLDADCRVDPGLVSTISNLAVLLNRPVQALNLSHAHRGNGSLHALSELGFRFKNLMRPLGLRQLGLPCHLMGTGMAIPWGVLRNVQMMGSHLAEDMQLGIELAINGHPAYFCPDVTVTSELPQQNAGFISQRTRWEQGHLRTSLTQVPRLLRESIRQRRADLFALALDLIVPPFSLLMVSWCFAFMLVLAAFLGGANVIPTWILASVGSVTAFTILACWFAFCRRHVPLRAVLSLPFYVLRKLPIYVSFLLGRGEQAWIRAERQGEQDTNRPAALESEQLSVREASCDESFQNELAIKG